MQPYLIADRYLCKPLVIQNVFMNKLSELNNTRRVDAEICRDVLGGDADAVGERGDAGGEAGELVGEARREVEPRQRAQERGGPRGGGGGGAGEPPRRRHKRCRRPALDLA